jgi:hypothetical protein
MEARNLVSRFQRCPLRIEQVMILVRTECYRADSFGYLPLLRRPFATAIDLRIGTTPTSYCLRAWQLLSVQTARGIAPECNPPEKARFIAD